MRLPLIHSASLRMSSLAPKRKGFIVPCSLVRAPFTWSYSGK